MSKELLVEDSKLTSKKFLEKRRISTTNKSPELIDARHRSLMEYSQMKEMAKNLALYEDEFGDRSKSGGKGIMIQVNRRLKSALGKTIDELYKDDDFVGIGIACSARSAVADVGKDRMMKGQPYKKIKKDIYKTVDCFINAYKEYQKLLEEL